jgi:ABC-type uncharacterized transport system substrate-binding protein
LCDEDSHPKTKDGGKWRIAYYEGGPYTDYTDSMRATIMGLMDLGWIEKSTLPQLHGDVTKPYWSWLAHQSRSKFLEFKEEDAYSANWNNEYRKTVRKELLKKLNSGTIDLIIAMGTWAGHDLANNLHRVPTTVMSTSDPIEANIIKSVEDSGLDHITARVDPNRYLRQIRMFHRLVKFKKLGVAYEDTPDGIIYSALSEVSRVAKERGFEIVKCQFRDTDRDREVAGKACIECFKTLAKTSDAIYLTAMLAIDEKIEEISDILKTEKVPSFSLVGSKYVKEGILMSISTDVGYKSQGLYFAKKIAKILNGTKPRELEQEFHDPLDIAINLETARKIGFNVPGSLLRIANEIYGDK